MGRRKKEPAETHRRQIGEAAGNLFAVKGIEGTSMDEIAKEAGYSKATLYVYFENKEAIVAMLVHESMRKLYGYIDAGLQSGRNTRERYDRICRGLLQYQQEFPFYFSAVLDRINIEFDKGSALAEERDAFQVGEEINRKMSSFLESGIRAGELRQDMDVTAVIFTFWGMLSGLIQIAVKKETYIRRRLGFSRDEFLDYGFDTLYRSIEKEGGR